MDGWAGRSEAERRGGGSMIVKDYDEVAKAALKEAQAAEDVIVEYVSSVERKVRFSRNRVDIAKGWQNTTLFVFAAMEGKVGSTEVRNPTPKRVRIAVSDLLSRMRTYEKSQLYGGISDGAVFEHSERFLDPEIDMLDEQGPELVAEAISRSGEEGALVSAGSLSFGRRFASVTTNRGAAGSYEESYWEFNIRSFVDAESSGQGLACGRSVRNIEEKVLEAAKTAGRTAAACRGGVQGKPGRYDVIASPTVSANLLGQLMEGASQIMVMLGLSALKGKLGSALSSFPVDVLDDPTRPEGLGSRPFDAEGRASQPVKLVDRGRLVSMLSNRSTSTMMGGQVAGQSLLVQIGGSMIPAPWPSNIVFSTGDATLDEMIEDSRRPTLYLTSNWYTRYSNYEEGSFSTIPRDGAFLVENGEVVRPVRRIRISDNIVGLFSRIEAMGKDLTQVHWWEVETPTFVPHVKFSDVRITAAPM